MKRPATLALLLLPALARAQVTCADKGCPPPPSPDITPLSCDCETRPTPQAPCPARRADCYDPPRVVRDPRPVALIACMNGNPHSPRLAAPWWGRPNGDTSVRELIGHLDNAYSRGFRRMVLYMPAGQEASEPEGAIFSSAQYWSLPCAVKRALESRLRTWIESKERAHDPVTLGVYAGSHVNRDVSCLNMHPSEPLDVSNAEHLRQTYLNVSPWAALGFREYWLDYAATKPCIVGALQQHPQFTLADKRTHVRFGGEAIPYAHERALNKGGRCAEVVNKSGQHVPDASYLAESPWVCAFEFVQDAFPLKERWRFEPDVWRLADPSGGLTPANTELGVIFADRTKGKYHVTLEDAARLFFADKNAHPWSGPWRADAGWVLWSGNEDVGEASYPDFYRYMEIVQRLYDMGTIRAAADYNADGVVDETDRDAANTAVAQNRGATHATYLMGDFDGDGTVTDNDLALYRRWWDEAVKHKRFISTNLRAPGPG